MAGRGRLIQTNFGGGEISRTQRARPDTEIYASALDKCRGFLVRPNGAMDRTPGTVYLGGTRLPTEPGGRKWFALRKSIGDIVLIEAGKTRFRFWDVATRSQIKSGGSPVELAIPWTDSELKGLRASQQGDVIWFTHVGHGHKTWALQRTASDTFTLTAMAYEEGPFQPLKEGQATLTFSGTTGTGITCTASAPTFNSDMVGALIRCEPITMTGVDSWSFDIPVEIGDFTRNGNRIYECTGATDPKKTGNAPPVHDSGSYWDGTHRDNILWTFRGYTYGLARITGYTSSTQVTVEILQRLPFYGADAKSTDVWTLQALSDDQGWPAAVLIHEDRFCAFGSAKDPDRCFLGRTERYGPVSADMRPGFTTETVDSDAVRRSLAEDQTAFIVWALVMDGLLLGTTLGVRQLSGPSADEALSPAGAVPRTVTEIPCSINLPGLKCGNALIYPALGDEQLIELSRSRDAVPRNLLDAAAHMSAGGIKDYCWQGDPARALWFIDGQDRLCSLTYSPENGVIAAARHSLAGTNVKAEAVISVPGPDGKDEVWLIVSRTVNGTAAVSVEYMERRYDVETMRLEDACVLDAAFYIDLWQSYTVLATDLGGGRVRLTAQGGATPFISGDAGRQFWLTGNPSRFAGYDDDGETTDEPWPVRVNIDTFTSSTVIEGDLVANEPAALWAGRVLRVARPTQTISSLPWLQGETISLNADGRRIDGLTVVSSSVTLPDGLWMARGWGGLSRRSLARSLPLNGGEGLGSARTATGRVMGVGILTNGIAEGVVRRKGGNPDHAIQLNPMRTDAYIGMAQPPLLDDKFIPVDTDYDTEKQIELLADGPLPCSVSGFLLKVQSYG